MLLVEFNELSPDLLHDFMGRGLLPAFSRLYRSSVVRTTDAGAREPYLEPWIQWPTVHLGVDHHEHGIMHLGDADPERRPGVAAVLAASGVPSGVFGSMNVPYDRDVDAFLLPDPWNTSADVRPESLLPFRHTVSTLVQDSARPTGVTPGARLGPFAASLLRHRISPRTARIAAQQLLEERRDPAVRWRRASVLDWMQYDVFRHLTRTTGARFASFFSNSTAHYQHYYWRNMAPEGFVVGPQGTDHVSLDDAILFGYRSMDALLARMLRDFPDATIVLATALSQEGWLDSTKLTYRPKSFDELLTVAGIDSRSVVVNPIMAEEFVVRFGSSAQADDGEALLGRLTWGGAPLLRFLREGDSLIGGCAVNLADAEDMPIDGAQDGRQRRLGDLFAPVNTVRSGRHSPVGALWIGGQHRVVDAPVSLVDIAPTVLDLFGVPAPGHMQGGVLV